jgi:hypothetical protein
MRSAAAVLAAVAYLLLAPAVAEAVGWRWPVEGQVVTPYANGSDPYAGGQHRGIDIAAPAGTAVAAAAGGVVTFAGPLGSSGLTVAIRSADGFDTSYLHLASTAVRAGDRVAAGTRIGTVGTSGRRSVAEPHLHFGVREAGTRFAYHDPLDLLPIPAPPSPRPPTPPVAARAPVGAGPGPVTAFGRAVPVTASGPVTAFGRPAPVRAAVQPLAPSGTAASGGTAPRLLAAPAVPARASSSPRPNGRPRVYGSSASPRLHTPARARTPSPLHGPAHRSRGGTYSGRIWNGTRATSPVRVPAVVPAARRAPSRAAAGFDLGWLAACIAMVVAAAILGRPRATTRSLRRAFDVPFARASSEPDPQ